MTTYNEIAGRRVNFLSSDPTYVDTNSNGQVWYNSSTATLKSWLPTGAWSAGGNEYIKRIYRWSRNSNCRFSIWWNSNGSSRTAATESYNGIAWTSKNSMNKLDNFAGFGTQTAALGAGGSPPVCSWYCFRIMEWYFLDSNSIY
jgi:hypothetical protein